MLNEKLIKAHVSILFPLPQLGKFSNRTNFVHKKFTEFLFAPFQGSIPGSLFKSIRPFHTSGLFLYLLKTSENLNTLEYPFSIVYIIYFEQINIGWVLFFRVFFSVWVFFHEHSRITGLQGEGEDIPSTPYYHFYPLHRYLEISRAITTESSPH